MADHGHGQPEHRAAEVPCRLPPRFRLAHARRADGVHLPAAERGRLLLNVVTGGESQEQRAYGDFLDKDARYRRTDEFLSVVRELWQGRTVDLEGDHLRVAGARLTRLPDPVPEVYFGGSSPIAGRVAAKHVDVYLTWGEPPAAVAEKIAWIRRLAAEEGPHPALRHPAPCHHP